MLQCQSQSPPHSPQVRGAQPGPPVPQQQIQFKAPNQSFCLPPPPPPSIIVVHCLGTIPPKLPLKTFQKSAEGYPPVVLLFFIKKRQKIAHQEY